MLEDTIQQQLGGIRAASYFGLHLFGKTGTYQYTAPNYQLNYRAVCSKTLHLPMPFQFFECEFPHLQQQTVSFDLPSDARTHDV